MSASELVAKQQRFAALLARLILFMLVRGCQVTLAEGYVGDSIDKPGEDTPHLRHGCHFMRLAQDLNLYRDGQLLTSTEAHRPFGEWWEKQDPEARWGGRWGDGGHYSLTHNGVA